MKAVRDFALILRLISDCIGLYHPISLDIRYLFHLKLSQIDGATPCGSREKWEEVVIGNKYSLWSFLFALCRRGQFRADVIAVLFQERNDLLLRRATAEVERID